MKFEPRHFRMALEEARRLVKAMPPAEVPHALRRTRASSSRRMTPVEELTLYRELDRNEEFRQATLDNLGHPSPPDADPRAAVSVLFLERSENWESQTRGYLAEMALEKARAEIERLRKRESDLLAENSAIESRAAEIRRRAEEKIRHDAEERTQTLERARERNAATDKKLEKKGREAEYWEKEARAAWDELSEVDRRYETLRRRYSLKTKPITPPSGAGPGREVGFSRDPLRTARTLDRMVSFWEVGSDPAPPAAAPAPRLELPAGLDPLSGGAVRWIYDDAHRLTLIVDGWNAAFHRIYHLHGQNTDRRPDQETVEFVTNKLDKLAQYSFGEHRVRIYLDSKHAGTLALEWENRFRSGRVTGNYVENADDSIAEEARRRAGEPVVVITSDRELADRCREHGAMVLKSEGLAEWMAESPV